MGAGAVLCPVLIGRDAERDALTGALHAARRGRGGCVWVSGEAGIGKSRLIRELVDRAGAEGAAVAVGRAVPVATTSAFRPWSEALLGVLRERPLPEGSLARWRPVLEAVAPAGVGAGAEGGGATEPGAVAGSRAASGEMSTVVRGEAVLRLLVELARPAGLVVVLEDLHWADPDSLAVLEYVADNLHTCPVLVVGTVRSEPPSPGWALIRRLHRRRAGRHLRLARLDRSQMTAMVRSCLPEGEAEPAVVAAVARVAEGVPFLVEEVLAVPGIPESFAESVSERLADFPPGQRGVIEAASVLGRGFDWRLLAPMVGAAPEVVDEALQRGVAAQLLVAEAGAVRFRHALTREAVLAGLLPPRRQALAAEALAALQNAHPQLRDAGAVEGGERTIDGLEDVGVADGALAVAAELAEQAGEARRAASLLLSCGAASLRAGALDTALAALDRATALGDRGHRRAADQLRVAVFALAGRFDEAVAAGQRLITRLAGADASAAERAAVHVQLARAAVTATRWPVAGTHLDAAGALLDADPRPELEAEATVLTAEVALAADDVDRARALAERALGAPEAAASVRCQGFELLGRVERLSDLSAARVAFERALGIAEDAELPLWALRALHELGTVELLERAGSARLAQARARAEELGALSTTAVLDLQLSVAAVCRFDLVGEASHAHAAVALAEPLGLTDILAAALTQLADSHGLRGEPAQMARYLSRVAEVAPDDTMLEAFGWGLRGMHALLHGSRGDAVSAFARAAGELRALPHANPAYFRSVWPLLAAAAGDPRAGAAIADNRRAGLERFFAHGALLGFAEAILAARRGQRDRADTLAEAAETELAAYRGWVDLARMLVGEAALNDRWGHPRRWLRAAEEGFTALGLDTPARRCAELLETPRPNRWERLGLTPREIEILELVAAGQDNGDIAGRLCLSRRTVEKHLQSLLRKTATTTRARLIALAHHAAEAHVEPAR